MVKGTNEMQQKEALMDQIEEEREKLNLLLDGDEISDSLWAKPDCRSADRAVYQTVINRKKIIFGDILMATVMECLLFLLFTDRVSSICKFTTRANGNFIFISIFRI